MSELVTNAYKLKPCPFCGELPNWHIGGESDDLLIFECGGSSPCVKWIIPFTKPHYENALQSAVVRWNKRRESEGKE
jgi:hypothetical protein